MKLAHSQKSKVNKNSTRALKKTPRRQITTKRKVKKSPTSSLTKQHNNSTQHQQTRSFFGLFESKSKRVVYELSQSANPLTLRTTLVPTNYKFPNYIIPSIDIVSVSSQQIVTPSYDELCYVVDKTPKVLQLPTISAVTNDSKFVNVFAEVTLCVSNGQKFCLVGENFLQVLQSLTETAISNVVSTISEEDLLDKQYEEFVLIKSHEELQRIFEDVGVDVLKTVIVPQQLDLTNVAAQLNLIKTMNDLSMAISVNNPNVNILSEAATKSRMTGEENPNTVQSADLAQLLSLVMNQKNQEHLENLRTTHDQGLKDQIEPSTPSTTEAKM